MNNLFDPKSPLGSAFNDIFANDSNVVPPATASTGTTASFPPVARIGAARQIVSPDKPR